MRTGRLEDPIGVRLRRAEGDTLTPDEGVSLTEELVGRAQRGEHAAFDELATAAFPRLWSVARRVLRDPATAEDAVQDCLLRAWRDLRALRDPSRFDAWLYRLLLRSCSDEARRARRRPLVLAMQAIDRTDDRDAGVALADRDLLERGFSRLTTDHRMVLVLHHVLGLRAGEIADQLGIPEGTVTSRIHYGERALRGALDADMRYEPDAGKR